jgi:hypothetical protein
VSDVVDRLREHGSKTEVEAAAEIERLNEQCRGLAQSAMNNGQELLLKETEIERLRSALKECADDLESELNGNYLGTLDYPRQKRRFARDMESVFAARKLLAD